MKNDPKHLHILREGMYRDNCPICKQIEGLEQENEHLKTLLIVATCPQTNCFDGAYPVGPDGDAEQCQWCYEKSEWLKDK